MRVKSPFCIFLYATLSFIAIITRPLSTSSDVIRRCVRSPATVLTLNPADRPPVSDSTIRSRLVVKPIHYSHRSNSANQHTWYAKDPFSGQPHLKLSPVAVQRLSFGEPEPWLQARREELNGESIEPFAARKFGGTVSRTVHTKV